MAPETGLDLYQALRRRVRAPGSQWLLLVPDFFHLLCRLAVDPEVPAGEKARLVGVIAYLLSPIDLLPELFTGPLGFADDLALAAYVLHRLVGRTRPEILDRHWAGGAAALAALGGLLRLADRWIGGGLWTRVRRFLG